MRGRDAALIEFAENNGHVVSMTIDHHTDESVGTCACGWVHRVKRGPSGKNTPENVKKRVAAGKAMDAAVTAHWADARFAHSDSSQPTADVTAAAPAGGKGDLSATLPAGEADDGQLGIPGFLDRRAPSSVKPAEAAE
jgi:hypothetical protein